MKQLKIVIQQWFPSLLIILLFIGCQSLKQWQLSDAQSTAITLGSIVQREGALQNVIETKTIPLLQEDLRVALVKKTITKNDLNRFNRVLQKSGKDPVVDASASSYTYLELELIDDIGYARTINNDQKTRDYVKNAKKAGVVTRISLMGTIDPSVLGAKDYFMTATDQGSYSITYVQEDGALKTVSFKDMTIFDFQVSYFCFGKDASGRIQVMDIVEEGKSCKRPLVTKPKKLQKTRRLIDY